MNLHSKLISQFPKKRILVIGDIMLDEYFEGVAERISPEAPIPVLLQKNVRHVLGGAGNVAANAAALGAHVTLIGLVGADERARTLRTLCSKYNIRVRFFTEAGRPTTTKMRFVSGHHQLVRIDIEESRPIAAKTESALIRAIAVLPDHDIVIISDYAKGCMSAKIVTALHKRFGASRIIADMKPSNAPFYKGVRAITPNIKEAHDMTGIRGTNDTEAELVTKKLGETLKTAVVLTRSAAGISVREKGKECIHFTSTVQSIKDVTGAGDTLIATLALSLASGAPFTEAARIANIAAGVVVGKAGTAALSHRELEESVAQ